MNGKNDPMNTRKVGIFLVCFLLSRLFPTGSCGRPGSREMSAYFGCGLPRWQLSGRCLSLVQVSKRLAGASCGRATCSSLLSSPLGYAALNYGAVWITGLGEFQPQPAGRVLSFATLGLLVATGSALGEEIGWRGFLLPRLLEQVSFTKAALLTGIVWAIWHYPGILFADYHSLAPRWWDLASLTFTALGFSFFTAWLRIRSGSIWPLALWHGAHNIFIQQIFLDLTRDTGRTYWFVDDFGIGVVLAAIGLGLFAWVKRNELTTILKRKSVHP